MNCDSCKNVNDCRFSNEGRSVDSCNFYLSKTDASESSTSASCTAHRPDIEELKKEFIKKFFHLSSVEEMEKTGLLIFDDQYNDSYQDFNEVWEWLVGALTKHL